MSEKCNSSCEGYLNYTRECACPAPKHGGSDCLGSNEKTEPCNADQCYKGSILSFLNPFSALKRSLLALI